MPVVDGAEFESMLADVFRKRGWRVRRHPAAGDMQADLVVDAGGRKYVIELKAASEGRRDRLLPLLSQAILQAQAYAMRLPEPTAPLAVVAAGRVSPSVASHLKHFAERHAPNVAIGIIDADGFRSFVGPGLEGLDSEASRHPIREMPSPRRPPDLFSDLNQWMLKIVLGQRLPEPLISVSRTSIRNASQLAAAADVSVMTASRLVGYLARQRFLDEKKGELQLVRVEELADIWIAANRQAAREVPARWIIKGGQHQLLAALEQYASRQLHNQPRCCLGLFAAADALGFGFVRGAQAHIYLERLTLDSLDRLGLAIDRSDRPADVIIRIPVNREAVFRASVMRDGVPVSDILQVWLDVSTHPARGREQADEIRRRVLKPLFGKQR
jgi:hypothetical protein